MKKALLLVDIQNDFLPGGALAVPNGDAILPTVQRLIHLPFDRIVTTQDWHPPGHISFASTHQKPIGTLIEGQMLWPDHCVQGTKGADHPSELHLEKHTHLTIYKGTDKEVDSYSGFYDNARKGETGLHVALQEAGIDTLYVAGLATDYCVKATVLDACELGYTTFVVREGCRGVEIHQGYCARAWEAMKEAGAQPVSIDDLNDATL